MGTWAWLIAYLLGFALLQLYLYRYFMARDSTANSSTESATPQFEGGSGSAEAGDDEQRPGASAEYVTCEQCGAHNDGSTVFTYCKQCGARL